MVTVALQLDLDVHTGGDLPLLGLIECYECLIERLKTCMDPNPALEIQYQIFLDRYRQESMAWQMPEE